MKREIIPISFNFQFPVACVNKNKPCSSCWFLGHTDNAFRFHGTHGIRGPGDVFSSIWGQNLIDLHGVHVLEGGDLVSEVIGQLSLALVPSHWEYVIEDTW